MYLLLVSVCTVNKEFLFLLWSLIEQKTKYFDRNANSLLKLAFLANYFNYFNLILMLIKNKACFVFWSQVADDFCT